MAGDLCMGLGWKIIPGIVMSYLLLVLMLY